MRRSAMALRDACDAASTLSVPLDATARAYIDANVDEEFRPYAWMIAKHESKSGDGAIEFRSISVSE